MERSVLDLVLRVGEALITTGAPVADTTAALQRLAAGFGVRGCQVDITFVSITATIDRDDDPITKVRIINVRTADYSRLAELMRLIESAGNGEMELEQARRRLDEILEAPHPYRRWVVTLAVGGMAAGVAMLLHGSWLTAALAAVTTMTIDRLLRRLRNYGVPYLFQQIAGGGVATGIAVLLQWGGHRLGWSERLATPSIVVAAGIVVLLAGLSLVGAAEDAISGYPLTAAARSFEVVTYTVGIVAGVGMVLHVAWRMRIAFDLPAAAPPAAPVLVQSFAGAVIAGCWALASYSRMRTVLVSAVVGVISATVYAVLVDQLSFGPVGSSFGGALVVGVLAIAFADRLGAPALAVSVCGITPLLPGLAIYRGMFALVRDSDPIAGIATLISAASIGLAIAAGVTLGEFVAAPVVRMDRWERRVRWRARGSRT
ncbi:MAG: threonine/serine exporter family protein [Mycobacteriaceae bacterium]|nr:threonine/serine exporter family protein [Mycobacteriaceae bacterium]